MTGEQFHRLVFILASAILLLARHAHAEDRSIRYLCSMDRLDTSLYWFNWNSVITEEGATFSRTDASHPYGIGWRGAIPAGNGQRNYDAVVSFLVRNQQNIRGLKVVFSIHQRGEQVYWNSVEVKESKPGKKGWLTVVPMSQVIPAEFTDNDCVITAYVWNEGTSSPVDVDDFAIQFQVLPGVTFLPPDFAPSAFTDGQFIRLYKGPRFDIDFDKANGELRIISGGASVFQDFKLYTDAQAENILPLLTPWSTFLYYQGDSLSEDGHVYRFSFRHPWSNSLYLIVPNDGLSCSFSFEMRFQGTVTIHRQSLFFQALLNPTVVVNDQGQTKEDKLHGEYWLGHGGIQWRGTSGDWLLYRPEKATSLQFDKDAHRVCVNVDYESDHPLLYWPLEAKSTNHHVDRSATLLHAGDRLTSRFSLQCKSNELPIPRIAQASGGRDAVLIFTEHADFTTRRSQRAVFYGSDTIYSAGAATKGFCGHRFPVTKSVFYANPDRVTVDSRAGFATGELASVKGTSGFRAFLEDLQDAGCEIVLHTPEHLTSSRASVKEALTEMGSVFGNSSWIDHGYDNHKTSNREDVACDGFVKSSSWYIGDIMDSAGVKYLWNGYYEDTAVFASRTFNSSLLTPHPAFGGENPRPVFWRHPSVTGSMVHFRTTCTVAPKPASMWNYLFSDDRLKEFARGKGVYIMHCYPARIDSANSFYDWNQAVWSVNPEFEHFLDRLQKFRDDGSIWVATVKDYLDYTTACQQVNYQLDRDGFVSLTNLSGKRLEDFTLAIQGAQVTVPGKKVKSRRNGSDVSYWFDFEAGETVQVKMVMEH